MQSASETVRKLNGSPSTATMPSKSKLNIGG